MGIFFSHKSFFLTFAAEKAMAAALAAHMTVPTAGDNKESAMCIAIPPKK